MVATRATHLMDAHVLQHGATGFPAALLMRRPPVVHGPYSMCLRAHMTMLANAATRDHMPASDMDCCDVRGLRVLLAHR